MHPTPSDQDLRYERKFVCDRHSPQAVDAIIRLHPAGFRRVHPPRHVNNVYLDSVDFSGQHRSNRRDADAAGRVEA